METLKLFLNTILIINIIITIYYFHDLEKYCKTENQKCINDPKRNKIVNVSIILLFYIILTRYIKLDGSIKPKENMKIIIFLILLSIVVISIYRIYIIYKYVGKLKKECNCKEYTIEYYLIKYHNLFQIFGLIITIVLFIIFTMFFYHYKNKYINIK